jgi:hypothetical protein
VLLLLLQGWSGWCGSTCSQLLLLLLLCDVQLSQLACNRMHRTHA